MAHEEEHERGEGGGGKHVTDLHPAFLSRHQPSFKIGSNIETDVEFTISADNFTLDTLYRSHRQHSTREVAEKSLESLGNSEAT